MKNAFILSIVAAAAFGSSAFCADYSIFRVCEDQRIIRTSDGAEAGHVEYIVVDPSNQRIVSTIVTGGVVGEKFVAVPFSSMQFDEERGITLAEITRERIVSAPVIERTQISSATVIHPEAIDRTYQYFGVRSDAGISGTGVNTNVRQGNRAEEPSRNPNVSESAARMRNDRDSDMARDEGAKPASSPTRNIESPERATASPSSPRERRESDSAFSPSRDRSKAEDDGGPAARRHRPDQTNEREQPGMSQPGANDNSSQMSARNRGDERPSAASESREDAAGSTANRDRPASRNKRGEGEGNNRQNSGSANQPSQSPSSQRRSPETGDEMSGGAKSGTTPDQENSRGAR